MVTQSKSHPPQWLNPDLPMYQHSSRGIPLPRRAAAVVKAVSPSHTIPSNASAPQEAFLLRSAVMMGPTMKNSTPKAMASFCRPSPMALPRGNSQGCNQVYIYMYIYYIYILYIYILYILYIYTLFIGFIWVYQSRADITLPCGYGNS